jgi:hypothetical protein
MTPLRATESDIPAIVGMGREFHAMSPHTMLGAYDETAVANMLRYLIDNGLVMTNGAGCLGGLIAPVYFNPQVAVMEEAFWWSKANGQELREAFEAEAKQMGAKFCMFSTLENDRSAAIDRVMRRNGYTPIERRYMKEL